MSFRGTRTRRRAGVSAGDDRGTRMTGNVPKVASMIEMTVADEDRLGRDGNEFLATDRHVILLHAEALPGVEQEQVTAGADNEAGDAVPPELHRRRIGRVCAENALARREHFGIEDRKSTRLNSSP